MYDIIVIGSGPAGVAAAKKAAQTGGKVALIEKGELGGVCLNTGCIPTKTLIHKAKVLKEANKLAKKDLFRGAIEPNWDKILADAKAVVEINKRGIAGGLKSLGVDVIFGKGEVLSDKRVVVVKNDGSESLLEYEKGVIVATGSIPKKIEKFSHLEDDVVFYSDDVFDVGKFGNLPKKILIVGGGAIGCEFASLFDNFGTEVTLVESMPSILSGILDEDFSANVARCWKTQRRKIEVICGVTVRDIIKSQDRVSVELTDGKVIEVDRVLVMIGRSIDRDTINRIQEDERKFGVIVVGDAAVGNGSAYTAEREGEKAAAGLMDGKLYGTVFPIKYGPIPCVIFADPEIAAIGITEFAAREKGVEFRVAKYLYRAMGRPHCDGEIAGEIKILVDENDKIIGVQLFGACATEIIQIANAMMKMGANYREWVELLWPHPVYSEIFKEALRCY